MVYTHDSDGPIPPEKVPAEKMESALELAERFEQFAEQTGGFSIATAWAFSNSLIAEGQNSEENFITLARYGLFIRNNAVFVAILEALDGGEAQENLYKRVAERYGEALRDEVFAGIGVAPFGIPTPEKPRYMQPVIARLEQALGEADAVGLHMPVVAPEVGGVQEQGDAAAGLVADVRRLLRGGCPGQEQRGPAAIRRRDHDPALAVAYRRVFDHRKAQCLGPSGRQ